MLTGTSSDAEASAAKGPLVIVGIGASAGGLEAIQAFFQAVPVDSELAYVVIQHLSPDHKSLMVELLSRKTLIPVQRAENGMEVLPNHVYLIPPKMNLSIFHGKLLLEEQNRDGISLPVDVFFRSLAEDQGERAVAVVLSGTGSDGARGVRAVKEWGGMVLVQDEHSAKFDGMPRAAASTGVADFILPPEEMPQQILACLRHPYAVSQRRGEAPSDETGMTRLFSLLRARTKVDFTYYKPSTINRRIERRIAVCQAADLDAYVRFVEQHPSELSSLYRELLIGVTSFFRDPEVWTLLREQVLPELFARCEDRSLRFWVAGASSGEEAYSLAILSREVMERMGLVKDLKIFATDIDREAVAKAGAGVYSASIVADLDHALLSKYFISRGETFQIARPIREMVVFAQHNLLKDPPFTRIELVSCRNLLIYLQTNLQQHALDMFSFSLNPQGILLLGNSETVGEREDRFEAVHRKARIYRSLSKSRMLTVESNTNALLRGSSHSNALPQVRGSRSLLREQERLLTRILDAISRTYLPLAVVVDEHLEIVHSVGDSSGLMSLPSGRAVYDISKMVSKELSIPLATGLQKVMRTGEEIVYTNVRVRDDADGRTLRLRLRPLPGRKTEPVLAVVLFEQVEQSSESGLLSNQGFDLEIETSQRLQDLEQELQFTRENLQATIEELETSNEELQATNEELLASNEELQSTNEELQSTNEELHTVNAEYQNKIIELTEANNDVENLLSSSRIGTIILDEDLCIRRFSPQAAAAFHLVDSDLGRPLKHISHTLLDFDPLAQCLAVQRSGRPVEDDVSTEDGRLFLLRIIPYLVAPRTFSGVVLTLIDITPLRDVSARLMRSQQTEADIVKHMPAGLFVYLVDSGGELRLHAGNPYAEQLTGRHLETMQGMRFLDLWPGQGGRELHRRLVEVHRAQSVFEHPHFEYSDQHFSGLFRVSAFPLPASRVGVAFEDVGSRVRAEAELRRIEWLLSGSTQEPSGLAHARGQLSDSEPEKRFLLPSGRLGLIARTVGAELLRDVVSDYLDLMQTSAAVYELDGDYALAVFASTWCQRLDQASRAACPFEDDAEAASSGLWACHESCWTDASKRSIETGEAVDIECAGGLHIYALPIRAAGRIVGSINFGYGDPPRERAVLSALAQRFGVPLDALERDAAAYPTRPPFIIELAKRRLASSARLLGEIVERKLAQEALAESEERHRQLTRLLSDAERSARLGSWTWEVASDQVTWSENLYALFGRDPSEGAPSFAEHAVLYTPESMEKLRVAVEVALSEGKPYALELTAVRGDGSLMRCIARGQVEYARGSENVAEGAAVSRLYGSLQESLP